MLVVRILSESACCAFKCVGCAEVGDMRCGLRGGSVLVLRCRPRLGGLGRGRDADNLLGIPGRYSCCVVPDALVAWSASIAWSSTVGIGRSWQGRLLFPGIPGRFSGVVLHSGVQPHGCQRKILVVPNSHGGSPEDALPCSGLPHLVRFFSGCLD